jgi:Tfp pilus assembly protein PilF
VIVAGAAIATYLTALPNDFVSDAASLIPGNPSLLNSHEWLVWFSRPYFWGSNLRGSLLYRPLTVLSYLATIRASGVAPFAFMAGNVLLHAGVSVLVLALGRSLIGPHAGLLGALLFAVHPLHTESVAWIGGRADLLASLFALVSVLSFLRATGRDAKRPALFAGLAVVAYFAGLLSKEHVITLPAWLTFVWFVERRQRSLRWTAVALVGCLAGIIGYVVLRAGVMESLPKDASLVAGRVAERVGVPWRWFAGLAIAGKYAGLFFWPGALTFDYTGYPAAWSRLGRVTPLEVLWGSVVVLGVLAALVWAIRAHRGLALALALIPVTYVVVSAFPLSPQLYIAERLTYLPSVGACLGAGWLLLRVAEKGVGVGPGRIGLPRVQDLPAWAQTGWGRVTSGFLLALLVALAARSAIRNMDWRTDQTVSRSALAVSAESPLALRGLGYEEYKRGNLEAARVLFERSLRLNPAAWEPYALLAQIYVKAGETEKAITLYRQAVVELPQRLELTNALGGLLWQLGRVEEAELLFRQVIAEHPDFFRSHLALGGILLERGRPGEALELFRRAGAIRPDSARAWFGMARASLALGRVEEARAYAEKARGAGLKLPNDFTRALERGRP